ncbi:MAG: hypothetical protein IAE79_07095 [Anaerolinea sp.]|nr:hypothetical protein [Anaerolinea sp.]
MNQFEESTESFVVKLWLDDTAESEQWQGLITHVSSGDRINFQNLAKIKAFIKTYLKPQTITNTFKQFFQSKHAASTQTMSPQTAAADNTTAPTRLPTNADVN